MIFKSFRLLTELYSFLHFYTNWINETFSQEGFRLLTELYSFLHS